MSRLLVLPSLWRCIAAAGFGFVLSGCASVGFVKREWKVSPVPEPDLICVRPFGADPGSAKVDRTGPEFEDFARDFGTAFAGRLSERLVKFVGPAKAVGPSDRIDNPRHWVIEGRFVEMKQGSRALRALIGFGLGGTRLECLADIYRVDARGRRQALAHFETSGGSNAEPGSLVSGPIGALPRLVASAATSGLSADARRTARMITAAISEKLSSQGVKVAGRPLRARELSPTARTRLQ